MKHPADFPESSLGIAFDLSPRRRCTSSVRRARDHVRLAGHAGEAHEHAFTVAKMMDVDLLAQVRDTVDEALDQGLTLQQFSSGLAPKLKAAGWWQGRWG